MTVNNDIFQAKSMKSKIIFAREDVRFFFEIRLSKFRFWLANKISGNALSEARAVYGEGWQEADRLCRVLQEIVDCETACANGTVKRMAKNARDALGGVDYD